MANKLILGTVQFGLDYGINNHRGKPEESEVFKILDLAFQNSISILDTAEAYGNSHERIGAYHKQSNNRFTIVTKFSSKRTDLPANLTHRIQQNIEVLQVPSLYAYMYHSFSDFETFYPEHKKHFQYLKSQGIIQKFGVSVYTNEEIEKLLAYDTFDLIQIPFNLLDNNSQRLDVLKRAKNKGLEIHTRSVFLQGLFFKELNSYAGALISLKPYVDQLNHLCSEHNMQLKDMALNYCIQQKNIDRVLIGVDTSIQLQENLQSLQYVLHESILHKIDSIMVKNTEMLNPGNWRA